jgi:hypothetical protein
MRSYRKLFARLLRVLIKSGVQIAAPIRTIAARRRLRVLDFEVDWYSCYIIEDFRSRSLSINNIIVLQATGRVPK